MNSTVSDNEAQVSGGGISFSGGTLTIMSSTVTGNALVAPALPEGGGLLFRWRHADTAALHRVRQHARARGVRFLSTADVVVKANDFNLFGHEGDAGVAGFTPGSTDIVPNKPIGGILLPLADNGGDSDSARTRSRWAVRHSMRARTMPVVRRSINAAAHGRAGRRVTSVRSRVLRCSAMAGSRRWSAPTDPMS